MNYRRFDRHEIFTSEDLKAVRDAIDALDELDNPLVNSLYGLYDGYLYDNLAEELYQVLDFKVFCNLTKTIQKIERLTDKSKLYSVEIYLRNPDDLSGGWEIEIEEVEATSKRQAADLIIRKHGILFDCFIEQDFQKFNDAWAN